MLICVHSNEFAGDHGRLIVSFADRAAVANIQRGQQIAGTCAQYVDRAHADRNEELMKSLFPKKGLTKEKSSYWADKERIKDPSCKSEAAAGRKSRTCAAAGLSGDQTQVCSIGYGVVATDCCFGWIFNMKPMASLLSSVVLGVMDSFASSVGGVGWCDSMEV